MWLIMILSFVFHAQSICNAFWLLNRYFAASEITWMLSEGIFLLRMLAYPFDSESYLWYYFLFGWGTLNINLISNKYFQRPGKIIYLGLFFLAERERGKTGLLFYGKNQKKKHRRRFRQDCSFVQLDIFIFVHVQQDIYSNQFDASCLTGFSGVLTFCVYLPYMQFNIARVSAGSVTTTLSFSSEAF